MPPKQIEFKPVNQITTGAIGPPGKRVFYLQARKDDEVVTLIIEKIQIQSLAIGVENFLKELTKEKPDLPPASADYEEDEMALETPIDPIFRTGQIGIGYDEESDLIVIVAREIPTDEINAEEGGMVRFWATRSQTLALSRYGLELASRGRPICPHCGEPIDPEGHFCPKRNGHKR
jgi:uncharacterized repeat protein (TIGR03847 family)